MKCSKCGEECNEKQAFCMKCGNPIQIIPDLNLIEEELANNVGNLLDEMEEENEKLEQRETEKLLFGRGSGEYLQNTAKYEDLHIPDIQDDSLEMIELARKHDAQIQAKQRNTNQEPADEFQVNGLKPEPQRKNVNEKSLYEQKMKRMRTGILCGTIAVIITIAVVVGFLVISGGKKDSKEKFVNVYNQGIDYYTDKKYEEAVLSFQKAQGLTSTEEEQIKANKALYDTYKKLGIEKLSDKQQEECISLLQKLIELDSKNEEHYAELISLYTILGKKDELKQFKESLVGTEMGDKLSINGVQAPVISPETGKYGKYITIKITHEDNVKVYYTTDGSQPNAGSTLYESSIEWKKQGEFKLQAIAIDEEGNESDIVSAEYEIKLESISAPRVVPASGTYTEATKIEVTVPEGMKAYYTIDAYGVTPDTSSTEYTQPIDMPRGKNVFSVILVDESGMSSSVTENLYQYNVARQYTYDQAFTVLKENLIDEGTIQDESGAMRDGASMDFAYKEITMVENNEYYLIEGTYKSSAGKVIDTYVYGVDTVTGDVVQVVTKDGKYKLK